MRRVIAAVKVAFCFAVTGCGSTAALNDKGSAVQMVKQPSENCEYLGTFYGRSHAQEYALNNLRNIVGENGGTHVALTNAEQLMQGTLIKIPVGGNSLTVSGIGYRCPQT